MMMGDERDDVNEKRQKVQNRRNDGVRHFTTRMGCQIVYSTGC
jgi:hypothetical protein